MGKTFYSVHHPHSSIYPRAVCLGQAIYLLERATSTNFQAHISIPLSSEEGSVSNRKIHNFATSLPVKVWKYGEENKIRAKQENFGQK